MRPRRYTSTCFGRVTVVRDEASPSAGHIDSKTNQGELDDSVSRIVERAALGKGNYDRKVFHNIWGTFTFGPENTVYLGAYRGFLRFWSDDAMPGDALPGEQQAEVRTSP